MKSLAILHDITKIYRGAERHGFSAERESSNLLIPAKIFNKRQHHLASSYVLLNFPNRHCATHLMTCNQQSLPSGALRGWYKGQAFW